MAQNTGKAYEKLTQRVFQALLSQQSVTTIRVEHDVTLQGITGSYQVDVYWEFETGGITYRTVIECKDWQEPVSQGTLLTLHSVLLDLPGQPRGVVVARNGFQEGATKFATAHGIALYELRAPRDQDWDGFITSVEITGELCVPKVHDLEFKADPEWLAAELERTGIQSAESIPRIKGRGDQLHIEREDGSKLTTVGAAIAQNLVPSAVGPPEWREYLFPETSYIPTSFSPIPRVRLRGLRALVSLEVAHTETIEVKLEPLVHFILKEVSKGTFEMLDAEGGLLKAGLPRPGRLVVAESGDED